MGQYYTFLFYAKIIRILRSCSMKVFGKLHTVNISKLNFWLLIYIALNNFKGDFLNIYFLHPQIFKYCPIINNTSMQSY